MEFARQRKGLSAIHGHQDLEPRVVGQVAKNSGVMWVVFDDEQRSVGRFQSITVICNTRNRDRRKARSSHLRRQYRLRELSISHVKACGGGPQISLGQIES